MSRNILNILIKVSLVGGILLSAAFMLAASAEAASVYLCHDSSRCVIRLEDGIVGDRVKVLDEKAHIVAQGQIIKRQGAYAIIAVKDVTKTLRKGYPVIVNLDNRNSNMQWAASFSDKDY